ncbi:hypothetical protein V1477_015397 [Vespula maculifrons]|uniref:Uncharacterized protein n=1 Tax=Vespula maculifrons TaxID=7453 RepID=A0ABD2BFP1_VESMC
MLFTKNSWQAKARTTLDISMSPRDDQSRFLFPILFNEVSSSYRIRSNTGAYHLTFHWYRRFNAARSKFESFNGHASSFECHLRCGVR